MIMRASRQYRPIGQRLCLISATVSPIDTQNFIGMMLIE